MPDEASGDHPDFDPAQGSKQGRPVQPGDETHPDRSISDHASYGSNAEQEPGGEATDPAVIVAENTSALGLDDGGPQAGTAAHEGTPGRPLPGEDDAT